MPHRSLHALSPLPLRLPPSPQAVSALRGARTLVVAVWRAILYTALRLRSPRLVCHEMLY